MIEIKIPATTANIGPGFDALGMAVTLYNTYFVEEIEKGLMIEGCPRAYANEDNLVYISMMKVLKTLRVKPKGIRISMKTDIPISRGLGSSAACILAGILSANYLAGKAATLEDVLEMATAIEGHPDNVTPALMGGMTASITEEGKVYHSRIKIKEGLKLYGLIPNFKLSTEMARSVLPTKIAYGDGVYNIGRVSLMLSALINGEFHLLKKACRDKLHQQYRGPLISHYFEIIDRCEEIGALASFLSGAGPTIMVMTREEEGDFKPGLQEILQDYDDKWQIKPLRIDHQGAVINGTKVKALFK